MSHAARQPAIPSPPAVIPPSPPASASTESADGYFAPTTRSATRRSVRGNADADSSSRGSPEPDARARTRTRDLSTPSKRRRPQNPLATESFVVDTSGRRKSAKPQSSNLAEMEVLNGVPNGHLSPDTAAKGSNSARISRSPSPLGLIPIHQSMRTFVHKHEVPRKILHVSIGFLTLGLYTNGYQPSDIHPVLMGLLVPITATDVLRRNWPAFNKVYISIMGALMRESEAYDKYNGVIFYLLGAWAVLRFLPKDVGVMGVVLLSWCDTAASTVGRLYGRYTPKLRQGKSLAGTAAAFVTGVGASLLFYGLIAPYAESTGAADNTGPDAFAFSGRLGLPVAGTASIGGAAALGVLSIVSGLVASASEAIDLFGWDDNFTIPVLSGVGLWAFFKVFGGSSV